MPHFAVVTSFYRRMRARSWLSSIVAFIVVPLVLILGAEHFGGDPAWVLYHAGGGQPLHPIYRQCSL